MRTKLVVLSLLTSLSLLDAAFTQAAEDKQSLTLESIFASDEFRNKSLRNVQWDSDGSNFTFIKQNPSTGLLDIHEYDIATGSSRVLIAGNNISYEGKPVRMSRYLWTTGRDSLLITGPVTITWDNQIEAPHYIYETATKKLWPVADDNPALRNVYLSPDGKRVGYVLDNNLYIVDLKSRSTHAVTTDGSSDVFNGFFDYGSTEFGSYDAWHWSPDGRKIAFWRLDVTDVKVFYIIDELDRYNKVYPLKYPNTGERHAVNQIGVFDVESGRTIWMDIGDNSDDYIPRINWASSSQSLAIQYLTRNHKKLDLLLGDVNTGNTKVIITDTDPAWIDITDDLMFYEKQDRFVWTSEKSGYRHAYLYDDEGNEIQLTRGDWEISSLIDLDEAAGWLYFYAKKDSFIDQHVYRVRLDGSDVQKLSKQSGWYNWQFSPDHKHVIESFSDARTPPSITLRQPDGEKVRVLEENKLAAMEKYAMPHTEFLKVKTADGILIDAYMIKPLDFDPGKKYPVIGYGYGNAGSQVVVNRWGSRRGATRALWHRYMAEQGYIIFAMDNRTTAGRGKAAKNLTYGHYAKYAILDYLEGVEYLKTLPYVDSSRLGFWGWSGGGYLAAALMTKGAPHFKTAVSGAPVINLDRYQAVGVERWMGSTKDNEKGYRETNLLNYADKLEGNLLLIHGTGDENVKFAFTLQFANALIAHNKQFDMMIYPNRHHGVSDAQLHLFTKITNYFQDKL
jgi:dipeptidyl-peptidase-4